MSSKFCYRKNYGIIRGPNYIFLLNNLCTLFGCGQNTSGQLGTRDNINRMIPTEIMRNVQKVIIDGYTTFILDDSDILYGCGSNDCGQLGLDDCNDRNIPTKIIENVKNYFCNNECVIVITHSNTVFGFGFNKYNQLGLIDDGFIKIPTQINIINVSTVSIGYDHTLFLAEGKVFATGCNTYGQLGLGDMYIRNTPTEIIINLENIVKTWAGDQYSLVLDDKGNIFSFGNNSYGQLGIGDNYARNIPIKINIENIIKVFLGKTHLFILTSTKLFGIGRNIFGELGVGDYINRNTPTEILINNVKKIICGDTTTILLCTNGQIYWTGADYYTNLGWESEMYTNKFIKMNIDNILDVSHYVNPLMLTESGDIVDFDLGFNPGCHLGMGNNNIQEPIKIDFSDEIYDPNNRFLKNANN